jgi:hypothetical protein
MYLNAAAILILKGGARTGSVATNKNIEMHTANVLRWTVRYDGVLLPNNTHSIGLSGNRVGDIFGGSVDVTGKVQGDKLDLYKEGLSDESPILVHMRNEAGAFVKGSALKVDPVATGNGKGVILQTTGANDFDLFFGIAYEAGVSVGDWLAVAVGGIVLAKVDFTGNQPAGTTLAPSTSNAGRLFVNNILGEERKHVAVTVEPWEGGATLGTVLVRITR